MLHYAPHLLLGELEPLTFTWQLNEHVSNHNKKRRSCRSTQLVFSEPGTRTWPKHAGTVAVRVRNACFGDISADLISSLDTTLLSLASGDVVWLVVGFKWQ